MKLILQKNQYTPIAGIPVVNVLLLLTIV